CPALAIPEDPYNRPDLPNGKNNFQSSAYFSRQASAQACFTAGNAGQAAGTVAGTGTAGAPSITPCADRIAPVSRLTRARVSRRHVVVLRGRSRDRGCGRRGAGRVRRV